MASPSDSAATGTPKTTTKRATTAKRTTTKRTAAQTPKRAPAKPTPPLERAVLIPVGAALIARDRVVSSVNDVVTTYSTPAKAQTQLKKFERRGTSARKGLERDVRKTRTRVERELRQRRRGIEKTVTRLEQRRGTVGKSLTSQVEKASSQLEGVFSDPIKSATKLQERVLSRA
jgi:hypothetical protein